MKPKSYTPKTCAADLTAKITATVKALANQTDEARISETMQTYFRTMARFHRYSPHNLILILIARPEATHVAGYNKWRQMNRFVKRGETGIPILAPCFYRSDPEDEDSPKEVKFFKVVYVFDLSQTEGEPLLEPPQWRSPERLAGLEAGLIEYACSLGITVEIKDLPGAIQGYSDGGAIVIDEAAGTKTLVHEIAHELMHPKNQDLDRKTRELEAEAVAYVVATHFGLTELASPNYLALWEADSTKIMARLDRIRTTAASIINALDPQEHAP